MRRIFLTFVWVFSSWTAYADSSLSLVPAGRPFPLTIADPREIRTALGFLGDSSIQAMVGSYLSLFSVADSDALWTMHFGLEGRGLFAMRQQGGRFPLETVDGTLGLYAEAASAAWRFQFRFTHVSAHLADGSAGTAIPFSRETVSFRSAYAPNDMFQVYAGLHKIVHTMPTVGTWAFQFGSQYFLPFSGTLTPFVAADLRWQEETAVNPSFSLQLGFALHEKENFRRTFRLYYSYFTGSDVRGQYYLQTRTTHSFGIEFPL